MLTLNQHGPLRGELTVPGDKSISHRAVMFGSLAKGTTRVRDILDSADVGATLDCFGRLGVSIESRDAGALSIRRKSRSVHAEQWNDDPDSFRDTRAAAVYIFSYR